MQGAQPGAGDVIRQFLVAHAATLSTNPTHVNLKENPGTAFSAHQPPSPPSLPHSQHLPFLVDVRSMLKATYSNGSTPAIQAVFRHRQNRNVLLWLFVFLVGGSLWWYMSNTPSIQSGSPAQSSVYIHKTEGEIDVLAWPEERWFEGPRNDSQLEKAALIMLVRYPPPPHPTGKLLHVWGDVLIV